MKNKSNVLFIIAAFLFIFAASSDAFSQIKVGGYKTIAETDAGAVAAADFAAEAQGKKQNAEITVNYIHKAESQLVQGTNFRLCMEVSIANADESVEYKQMVLAVVYRNLKQQYSLSKWTEEECAEEEE